MNKVRSISQEQIDAMRELTVPQRLAFTRRQLGMSQQAMAKALGMRQGYYSRLEQSDKHLASHYQSAAAVLGWRLVIIPQAARVILPPHAQ